MTTTTRSGGSQRQTVLTRRMKKKLFPIEIISSFVKKGRSNNNKKKNETHAAIAAPVVLPKQQQCKSVTQRGVKTSTLLKASDDDESFFARNNSRIDKRHFFSDEEIKIRMTTLLKNHLNKQGNTNESNYVTKKGWCLLEGLVHIASAHNRILLPIIEQSEVPSHYFLSQDTTDMQQQQSSKDDVQNVSLSSPKVFKSENKPCESFRSLCRIITGQQLTGAAAQSVWSKLLTTVGGSVRDVNPLTPAAILTLSKEGEEAIEIKLRKPAGLSNAKVRSIIDLARNYESGHLSDEDLFLSENNNNISLDDENVQRMKLLKVKGIGPWTCDMFQLFEAQLPDVFPIGDLGVRKGTGLLFGVKGKGKNGALCEKLDKDCLRRLHEPFAPFRSLSTHYMWKIAETTPKPPPTNRP